MAASEDFPAVDSFEAQSHVQPLRMNPSPFTCKCCKSSILRSGLAVEATAEVRGDGPKLRFL
jgi:hypothetical protein